MIIYPAIDIMDGKCVRLTQGDAQQKTVYDANPVEMAKKWESKGATRIHVVDLDGAFQGQTQNTATIEKIIQGVSVPVQVGGGLRQPADMKKMLNLGAYRVVVGTSVVENLAALEAELKELKEQLVISLDAKNGFVTTQGWVSTSQLSVCDFAAALCKKGFNQLVYTDISRDGMLSGPNFEGVEKMIQIPDASIIASGGVNTLEDVKRLKELGAAGVIIGKALYQKTLDLEDILAI